MDNQAVYGQIGNIIALSGNDDMRTKTLGLFLTMGIAKHYSENTADPSASAAARDKINKIINAGLIPDPTALKAIKDALEGSENLETDELYKIADYSINKIGSIGALAFADPLASLTISMASEYALPFAKYLTDPNNIFTNEFAAPRIDPLSLVGAVAWEQLGRMVKDQIDLGEIYKEYYPWADNFKLGDPNPTISIENSLSGELSEPLKKLLQCDTTNKDEVNDSIKKFETAIYSRMDSLEDTTKETLKILNEEKEEKERQRKLDEIQREEQKLHQEITGGISIVGAFAKLFSDENTANKVTGCLQAAQSTYDLFSNFAKGSIGPLGLAGGLVNAMQGVFGLFNEPDPRIDIIDKKLDRLKELMIQGFQHIDARLTEVLDLTHSILNQLVTNGLLDQIRYDDLKSKVDFIIVKTSEIARQSIEHPVDLMPERIAESINNGTFTNDILLGTDKSLTDLFTNAVTFCRKSEMNGKLSDPSVKSLSILIDSTPDIRNIIGNLQYALNISQSNITIADQNLPDIKHWSKVGQGILEIHLLVPELNINTTKKHLQTLWNDGNKIKSSILLATNKDLFLNLLDHYEALLIRSRSNSSVATTLDEEIFALLSSPFPNNLLLSIDKQIDTSLELLNNPLFDQTKTSLRFLLSVLAWRVSDFGNDMSILPGSIDFATDKYFINSYLYDALQKEVQSNNNDVNSIVEPYHGDTIILKKLALESIIKSFSEKVASDIDKLRKTIPNLAITRRVRDVDEVLLGILALAQSNKIDLVDINIPLLKIKSFTPPRNRYELNEEEFKSQIKKICQSSDSGFNNIKGNLIDAGSGRCNLTDSLLKLEGYLIPDEAPGNINGNQTYLRIYLPEPINSIQQEQQANYYEELIITSISGIDHYFDFPPICIENIDLEQTINSSTRYYSRELNSSSDYPSEIALVMREIKGENNNITSGFTRFTIELFFFTRKSGLTQR